MALHEIIYVSLATRDMAQPELLALLDPVRFYNEAGQGGQRQEDFVEVAR